MQWQAEGVGIAKREFAPYLHAGTQSGTHGIGWQIDIDQGVAALHVHGRCQHADTSAEHAVVAWCTTLRTGRCRNLGTLSAAQLRQLGGGDFGPPLQPVATDQSKQFLSRRHYRAQRGQAAGDGAGIGRQHTAAGQAQLLRVALCLGRQQSRLGGFLGRQPLRDLLLADGATGLHLARPGGIGARLGQCCLGLGQRGLGLGQIDLYRCAVQRCQHLPSLDAVTDVDRDLRNTQPANLGAENGFLPGSDIAAGAQLQRPVGTLCLHHLHRQRGLTFAGLAVLLCIGACTDRVDDYANEHANEHAADREQWLDTLGFGIGHGVGLIGGAIQGWMDGGGQGLGFIHGALQPPPTAR